MVCTIDIQTPNKNLVYSRELSTQIKNSSDLFEYISKKFEGRLFLVSARDNCIEFSTRINRKKIFVEIYDSVDNNSITVNFVSKISKLKKFHNRLAKNRTFGVKNSFWIVLFSLLATFATLFFIFRESVQALQLLGNISLSIAGLALVMYFVVVKFISDSNKTRIKSITELSNLIESLVQNYEGEKLTSKICWNCFSETDPEQKICMNCKKKFR